MCVRASDPGRHVSVAVLVGLTMVAVLAIATVGIGSSIGSETVDATTSSGMAGPKLSDGRAGTIPLDGEQPADAPDGSNQISRSSRGGAAVRSGATAERRTITLVTGDTVTVDVSGDDVTIVDANGMTVVKQHGLTYVYPADVDRERYSRNLFNVDLLVDEGLTDAKTDSIPIVVDESATQYGAANTADASAMAAIGGVSNAEPMEGLGATAIDISKRAAPEALSAINRQYDVEQIQLDRTHEPTLDTSVPAIDADTVRNQYGVNGSGVTVAVLDTGVDDTHPDLDDAVVDEKDFTGTGTADNVGHGTHVAGTVAGDGSASNGSHVGVAPGANIMNVKVLSKGGGYTSDVAEGVDYAVNNGADVIVMSLGSPDDGTEDVLTEAVRNATEAGVVTVVAAGNEGDELSTITSPGSVEEVLTVGATSYAFETIPSYSSRGPTNVTGLVKPDVVAPGTFIDAAEAGSEGYTGKSGTSMATPHVGGLAALLIANDSSRDHHDVKHLLASQAETITDGTAFSRGTGQVNATRAFTGDIVLEEAIKHFGVVDAMGTPNRTFVVRNRGDQTHSVTLNGTLVQAGTGTAYHDRVTLNRTSLSLDPGERAGVKLTVDTYLPSGYFAGDLTATDGSGDLLARGAYGFVRTSVVTANGSVSAADGTALTDDRVRSHLGGQTRDRITDASGAFEPFYVPTSSSTRLWYHETTTSDSGDHLLTPQRNDVPDIYLTEEYSVTDQPRTLDLTLPEAHLLEIQVVDGAGNPVENARVDVGHSRDGGTTNVGTDWETTTSNGWFKHEKAEKTGIELDGNVTVTVAPPEGPDRLADETIEERFELTANTTATYVLPLSTVNVTGRIEHGDVAAADDTVLMEHNGTESPAIDRTAADGNVSLIVERGAPDGTPDGTYELEYYQGDTANPSSRFARDGNVDLYVPTEVNASDAVDLGTITLPAGHVVNATARGPTGDPVENATVTHAHTSNDSVARGTFTFPDGTDGEGRFRQDDGTFGLEVADNITVTASSPAGHRTDLFDNTTASRTLDVSADGELSFTLSGVSVGTNLSAPVVGQSVAVNASESVGTITSYEWEFGDTTSTTTASPTDAHTYTTAGNYTVSVTATNDAGETATTTTTVSVRAAPTVEVASITDGEAFDETDVALDVNTTSAVEQDTLEYAVDGGSWTAFDGFTTLSSLSEGTHDVSVRIVGEGGTVHDTDSVSFTVDTTAPGITGVSVERTYYDEAAGLDYANETVSALFDITNDDADSLDAVTVVLDSRATTFRRTVAASNESGTWNGTVVLNETAVPDDATYDLRIRAVDDAGNVGNTTANATVVDRSEPRLSAAISQNETGTGIVTVRSSEPLRSAPAVNLSTPNDGTKQVAVTATGAPREYNATIELNDSGTYTVGAEGVDLAGNRGTDTASASVNASLSTGTDTTAAVVNVDTGSFVEFRTHEPVSDAFVSLSENEDVYEPTTDDQVGLGSLTGVLGDTLAGNLTNATIAISVENTTLPPGIAQEEVTLSRYNETAGAWTDSETNVTGLDRPDLGVSGIYWVANVSQFSTYGVIAADTDPPELSSVSPATNTQLPGGTETTDVTFQYADDGTGVNVSTAELAIDGTTVTTDDRTAITSTKTTHTDLSVSANQSYTATLNVTDRAGNEATFETIVTVPPDPSAVFAVADDPTAGEAIVFDAGDSTGALTTYNWTFDDGANVTTASASTEHTYDSVGSYDVTLAVTDDGGQTATTTKTVNVSANGGGGGGGGLALSGSSSGTEDGSDTAGTELAATLAVPDTVAAGEQVAIGVDVENVGGESGETPVTIAVDGTTIATRRVTLDAGESTTVTATAPAPASAAGRSLSVEAATSTGSMSTIVQVTGGAAALRIETVEFLDEATSGDTASVTVTLANEDDEPAAGTVAYAIGGTTQTRTDVTLAAGGSTTATLEASVPANTTGTVTQSVSVGDQQQSESLTISSGDRGDGTPGFGALAAVLAVAVAIVSRLLDVRRI